MKTKFSEANQSEFFNLRVAFSLLVCGAVAWSMMTGTMLAFFRPEAPAKVPNRTLTFADRVELTNAQLRKYTGVTESGRKSALIPSLR